MSVIVRGKACEYDGGTRCVSMIMRGKVCEREDEG